MKKRSNSKAKTQEKAESRITVTTDTDAFILSKILQNATIPIIRLLPVEILIDIFLLLQSSLLELDTRELTDCMTGDPLKAMQEFIDECKGKWDWTVVTRVCHHWRVVALNCPALWAKIETGFHTNVSQTKTYLERSKSADISLSHFVPEEKKTSAKIQTSCLLLALKELPRIRVLRFRVDSDYQFSSVQKLLTHPAPKLERFQIMWKGCVYNPMECMSFFGDIFDGSAPQLQSLSLTVTLFNWHSPLLRNLKSLTLNEISIFLSFDALLAILGACPELEDLTIANCQLCNSRDTATLRPISLRKLKIIEIDPIDSSVYEEFMRYITLPEELSWAVNILVDDSFVDGDADVVAPPCIRRKSPCKDLSLMFSSEEALIEEHFIRPAGPRKLASATLAWGSPCMAEGSFELVSKFIENGFWCNATSLLVDLSDDLEWFCAAYPENLVINENCWTSILKLLPSLEVLRIASNVNPQDQPCTVDQIALMHALTNRSGTGQDHLCPQLSELVLIEALFKTLDENNENVFAEIRKCLKARSESGVPIKRLEIKDGYEITDEMIETLRKDGFVDNIVWDGVYQEMIECPSDSESYSDEEDPDNEGSTTHSGSLF